jgi:hypothetical protein
MAGGIIAGAVVPLAFSAPAGAGTPILFQTLPAGTVGVPYSTQISYSDATGGPYTFSIPAPDSTPPGLTMTSSGLVSGTPTEQANAPVDSYFDVSVEDPGNTTGEPDATIDVDVTVTPPNWTPPPALQITTTSVPGATVGQKYSASFQATGGITPYSWGEAGSLPSGIAFSNGTLSGTTSDVGTFNFIVTVGDADLAGRNIVEDEGNSVSQSYTLTVASPVTQLDPVLTNLESEVGALQGILSTVTGTLDGVVSLVEQVVAPGCLESALGTLLEDEPPNPSC